MKIITNGDIEKAKAIVEFKCFACGCVFEAEKGEYVYRIERKSSGRIVDWYTVKRCPCCGQETMKMVPRIPNKEVQTPVYPTWYRWISDINGGAVVDHAFLLQQIPDDIAEKLGVKPLK